MRIILHHIIEASQQRREFITIDEISTYSMNGIEFAGGVLYAESLGIRVVGRIPPWVSKITKAPDQVHPNLFSGVRNLLSEVHVSLSPQGELSSLIGDSHV